jgi:hypothetical protein
MRKSLSSKRKSTNRNPKLPRGVSNRGTKKSASVMRVDYGKISGCTFRSIMEPRPARVERRLAVTIWCFSFVTGLTRLD